FYCCQQFIRLRKRAGGKGKIINITSVHEEIPTPRGAAYGASKGGLKTFTRSLSLELAPDRICVNAIAPGLIRTPMTAKRTEDPETMQRQLPRIPLRRAGEPWEVALLALYLASDYSDYVTGQSFTIDGGLEMNWGHGASQTLTRLAYARLPSPWKGEGLRPLARVSGRGWGPVASATGG